MMTRVASALPTIGQLVGLVVFLVGFYLVVGLAWTTLVAGLVTLVVSVLAEYTGPRLGWKDGS